MRKHCRCLRSKRHRRLLWKSSGGKCVRCGAVLDASFHADHKISWKTKPETNIHKMQPLCRDCNLKKGCNDEQ
jgi:5-methylcytosine-specific restriction endonuclease McrA